ncbi:hypothetical protein BY996DRAFT_7013721 [Phakopsora pachyrhizi]|nr:hypothetical protein BY996DRAFT_7116504 [Phakopsora pachyrhizi]KAI8455725.1 hypothetical protein BY996DRAFT_7013721 [Phakopsora pachyrhizi]
MGGGEADTESKELVQRQQEQQQQPQSQQQQHQLQKQYSHEQQQNNHTQSLQLQSSSAAARFSPSLSSRAPSVSYSMPRSTTPSFTSQLPSLTNNNRKPLIGLESPSQKTIQSPSKPSQIFPHPYSSQQQVNGNQHHPIPLTRTQSPSTSTPLYPRRLPISPSFTKHYPDNSVLGPDGRPRSRKKLSLEEQRKLSRWIKHDEAFEIAFQRDRMQKRAIMQDVCRQQVMINRLDWLGEARNGRATGRCQIRLPLEREREGSTGKRKNRPRLKLNKSEIKLVSEVEEILVPIRLEIEIDHWKLRDTFTWNLKEPVVTPEQFAAHLCEDLILPAQHFIGPIVNSIREQLDEYRIHQNFEGHYARHSSSEARNPDSKYEADVRRAGGSDVIKMIIEDEGNGEATQGAEEKWWNGWKGRVFDLGCDSEAGTETDEAAQIQEIKPGTFTDSEKTQSHYKSLLLNGLDFKVQYRSVEDFQGYNPLKENDDELRIPIVLDIICGHVHLTDRFEWEISEVNNSPEDFVEVYVNDLGLAGEFKTAIAHSIREQIETYVKSLALVEHVNGYPVPNDELRYAFLQPITEPIRTSQVDDYTPFLNFLNAEELDRQEKEHDREARRKRRQTRSRRGITLPDRESQRTVRSIVPIQGMKMVMPYQDDNEDLIVPVQPVAEPYPIEESVFENVDPPEHIPKKNVPVNKEPPGSEPLFGTPSKVVGNRVSRRLRGATADGQSGTPPPTSRGGDSNQPEKDDAPTPSNSGTPAPNTTTKKNNKQQEVASQTNSAKKFSAGRPRGINWKALGLHDPMINGVWHCSNCGCPEHIAVGRRKGLGGKDTLCGECGRYMHRYKKNRPTVYNTSADYHTSLKLEADSAKQAIADQEMLRQEKNRLEHLATRGSENKKPKKEGKGNLMPKSERLKRSIERSLSTASSVKSSGSRESSPIASTRPEKKLGTGKKLNSNKRLRTDDAGESNLNTRSAKSKKLALHSPGSIDSPETTSPSNGATPTLSLPPSETNAKQGRGGAKAREKRLVGASEKKKSISPSNETTTSSTAASESKRDEVANQDLPEEVPQKGRPSRKNSVLNDDEKSKVALQNTTNTSTKSNASPVVGEDLSRQTGSSKANSIQGESTKEKSARVGGNGRPISGARGRRFEPPSWMLTALSDIRSSFPSDKVELIPRLKREVVTPGQPPVVIGCDWRLKCFDCPGKLYTVGPGESFSNFDVHLKNRQHRQKVDERLNASQSSLAAQPVSQQQPLSQSQTQAQQSPSTNSQSSPQAQSRPQIEPLSQQSLSQQSPHLTPQSQPQQPRAQPAINHRSSIPGLPSIPLSPQVSPRVSQSLAVPPAVIAPGPVHPLPTLPNSSMNQVSQSTGNGHPTPNTILPAPPSTLVHPLPKKPML